MGEGVGSLFSCFSFLFLSKEVCGWIGWIMNTLMMLVRHVSLHELECLFMTSPLM